MKNNTLFSWILALACLTMIALTAETQHRNGCKEMGDACVCPWMKGFCLPGWMSNPPDQLYCDCSSDVYSEEEILDVIIATYCSQAWSRVWPSGSSRLGESDRNGFNMTRGNEKTSKVLQKIFAIVGENPQNILKNAAVTPLLEELKLALRSEKSLPYFIRTDGVCFYIGQECVCANTGRKGVCSATRRPLRQQISVICHCN